MIARPGVSPPPAALVLLVVQSGAHGNGLTDTVPRGVPVFLGRSPIPPSKWYEVEHPSPPPREVPHCSSSRTSAHVDLRLAGTQFRQLRKRKSTPCTPTRPALLSYLPQPPQCGGTDNHTRLLTPDA